ncbi:unnamed protein product [Durusdinium trenchii]|uniref:Uncharacterized protein n=1 Tax=Durusdinium trenchii TaxID=1381693 RepID=A0ABP0NAV1_9DINO
MVSNEVAEGMKIVASISSTTSARVNLMFRSNNRLKALWTEVLTIGKQALDQNNALKDAETVTSELSKLKDLLLKWDDQNDFKTLDALEEAIRSCSKATALRTVCHASNDSAVTEAGQKLDQSLQAVQGVISTAFQASVCLKDFLETLWTDNLAVPEQQLSIGGKDINVRTFLTYLRVEGMVSFDILREKHGFLVRDLAQLLLDFHLGCPDEHCLTLKDCGNAFTNLQKVTEGAKKFEDEINWIQSFTSCEERFSAKLRTATPEWIKAVLTEEGPAAAAEYAQGCIYSVPYVKPYCTVLINHNFLTEMALPENHGDWADLGKRIKDYVTLKTMDIDVVKLLFPEQAEKVPLFLQKIQENVVNYKLASLKKELLDVEKKTEKYRSFEASLRTLLPTYPSCRCLSGTRMMPQSSSC